MEFLRNCFTLACFSAALGMTIWWCYKFSKDESLSEIEYHTFENSEDYENPMMSICFLLPVDSLKLMTYNDSFSPKDYQGVLMGNKVGNGMESVDFNFVTLNLTNHVFMDELRFRNGKEIETHWPSSPGYNSSSNSSNLLEVTYSGFYHKSLIKCFGLWVDIKKVSQARFYFDTLMYPKGYRPGLREPFHPFTYIHLPNQIFLAGNTLKETWPERKNNLGYSKRFTIIGMDILKSRNKISHECIDDGIKYDEYVMKNHIERFGCKPLYLNIFGNYSVCSGKEKLRQTIFDYSVIQNMSIKPCTTVQNVNYRYEEADYENKRIQNRFTIEIVFPDSFKEIVQVKAVDIQTVIGNAGGYVGLFCGKYKISLYNILVSLTRTPLI